ncbi:GmrSD restriction endonuclease domain-containing protein [Aquilutibacter rugosus]|uniref:GmrSD restriction endonuclease domain-containing protein n=1 Tax=Aquilutibacter rugosus TaxID=3115820 RepID=UPI002F3FA503
MKAQDLQFIQLLQGAKQFIIPIFQRTYSWEIGHCEQLWNDILRVGGHAQLNSHFIGSAVYIPEQETSAAISRWLVIDGQQRITTLTLLLLALKRRLEKEDRDTPVSAAEIEDYFLLNRHGKGEQRYKLLLTKTDKDTLVALLDGKPAQDKSSHRIKENFEFFTGKIAEADLDVVYAGIGKLMIVDVRLQQGIDNPQMIFESMNSTGKALTQADLIRNYVLMGLPHEQQTRLYEDYWRPMELLFGVEHYNKHFDEFMRFFLVIHTGNHRIRKDDVYSEFKIHSRGRDDEPLLAALLEFARYYCRMALGSEKDSELASAFHDIRELRADVCYPMLMEVYHDYTHQQLDKHAFVSTLQLVESYVFRRAICDVPTNSLRQTFATFCRKLDKSQYLESVKAAFILLPSYRRFPGDDEFRRQLQIRNLYKFNRRSYWLRRFENFDRKERVMVQDYTIEHIMPQNPNLSAAWQRSLGADWARVQEQYLHSLGNLTLTGYNSEYSDYSFAEKRDMKGGFKQSPLKLNQGLGDCTDWNEQEIKRRGARLSEHAVDIWKAPALDDAVLDKYRDKRNESATAYTIGDHPNLASGPVRELFDHFRSQVLALDECVYEEFLKLYVAFKAETNFVDVVPQAKRLRLSLNMAFSDIDDPRKLCVDVTDLGHWGNGCVEVGLESEADLPYVMGLVRQALERQLGEDDRETENA